MTIATLLVLATTLVAQLDHAWFGDWVLDRDASHLTGDSVVIAPAAPGPGFDLRSFTPDPNNPASAPSATNRPASLVQAADGSWSLHAVADGHPVLSSKITLSPDQKGLTIVTTALEGPAGTPASTELYDRVGAGSGLAGLWGSHESAFGVADVLDLSLAAGGAIRWDAPKDQQFYVVRPNGPPAPYQGRGEGGEITVALKFVSSRQLRWTEFLSGKPYVQATDSLSADGQRLTEVSWQIDEPAVRQIAVYQRQAAASAGR